MALPVSDPVRQMLSQPDNEQWFSGVSLWEMFDRSLVAQAQFEGVLLLTADEIVATYPGPVRRV